MNGSGEGVKPTKTFRGTVRVNESDITLESGGISVQLEGDRDQFAPLNGLVTTVTGEQQGDVIRNAAPVSQSESAAVPASGVEVFQPVVAAIKQKQAELLNIPGVFGLRPGFRTVEGKLNHEPVIVIVTKPDEQVQDLPSHRRATRI